MLSQIHGPLCLAFVSDDGSKRHLGREVNALFCYQMNRLYLKISLIFLTKSLKNKMGFLSGSDSKELACNAGDLGSIPGLGRSP